MQTLSQLRAAIDRCDLRPAVTTLGVRPTVARDGDGVYHLTKSCADRHAVRPARVPLLDVLDGTVGSCCAHKPRDLLNATSNGPALWHLVTATTLIERLAAAVKAGKLRTSDDVTWWREQVEKKLERLPYQVARFPQLANAAEARAREVIDSIPTTELAGGHEGILRRIRDQLVDPACQPYVHLDPTPTLIAICARAEDVPTADGFALIRATQLRSDIDGVVLVAPAYVEGYLRRHAHVTITSTPALGDETNRVAAALWTPDGGPLCDIRTAAQTAATINAA